jgi:glycosyltransferase involved in cell wall biosynthesis
MEQLRRAVPGGIGTYALELARALGRLGPDEAGVEVALLASRGPAGDDPVAVLGLPLRTSALPAAVLTRLWSLGLPRAPREAALVHATSLAAPPSSGRPLVVTVHDLAWRFVPGSFPARGRRWHERALGRARARAAAFVVPSRRSADDLAEAGVRSDRIAVVPHGADHLPAPDHDATSEFLAARGVIGPFVLAVGTLEPRKNLPRLFAAYRLALAELPEPWPLVVVGPSGWGPSVEPVAGVVLAGRAAPAVLAGLYGRARCTVYVPLLEGFGLPVAESMAAGTPVVTSAVPAAGGASIEVDPHDAEAIAAAMVRAAVDGEERALLAAAARERAAVLTWRRAALAHAAIWRAVIAGEALPLGEGSAA